MKSGEIVEAFTLENASGQTVPFAIFTGNPRCTYRGPTVRHLWRVNRSPCERLNPRNDGLNVLPDASGFLLCEHVERPDNLVLLDAYGKECKRLSVPWQLTRRPTPASAPFPSRFIGLTTPWANPATGAAGHFAVLAWVEYAGDYAFELDWRTGEFLWGYFLERG
jgi:hypothetical protein